MRIATVYKQGTANAAYRAMLPLQALERRGHKVFWPSREGNLLSYLEQQRPHWDLTYIQQLCTADDIAAVRLLQQAGVAVVWDTDDDMAEVPRKSPAYYRFGGRKGIKEVLRATVEIASSADLMTTTSAQLRDTYRAYGVQRVRSIENYLADAEVRKPRRRHPGIVVGICSAIEHEEDVKQLRIGKALRTVLDRHDDVRVVAIGNDLRLKDHRYSWSSSVPFERLLDAEREFDIGLAPLVDTAFNRARSNVKLKEYAAAGAMWLASPVGPYVGMGEQEGGRLVAAGDWADTISEFVTDYRRRVALAESARAWAAGQTIDRHVKEWELAFRAALETARGRVTA